MNNLPKLLYILAPSYSGSTLLTYLMTSHSQISSVGELKARQMGVVEEYRCSCGSLINTCVFWKEVGRRADQQRTGFSIENFGTEFHGIGWLPNRIVQTAVRGVWFEVLRDTVMHVLPQRLSQIKRVVDSNRELSKIICAIQGGAIFLDGSKDSSRLLHLVRSKLWNIKTIYLQRDGRGVVNSYRTHRSSSFSDALASWKKDIIELENMRNRLSDDLVFDLHYEDLCKDPENVVSKIWKWMEIDQEPIRKSNFKCGEFHIIGNSMRLRSISEIQLDESWKSNLSSEELTLFEHCAGKANRRLGYE